MRTRDHLSPQSCKDLRVWQSCSVSMGTTVHSPGGFARFGVTMAPALLVQPVCMRLLGDPGVATLEGMTGQGSIASKRLWSL